MELKTVTMYKKDSTIMSTRLLKEYYQNNSGNELYCIYNYVNEYKKLFKSEKKKYTTQLLS